MRGRGIRDGEEREWSKGGWGGTCSYNFDSLFQTSLFLVLGERATLTRNEWETKAITLERDRARAEEQKAEKVHRRRRRRRREERDLAERMWTGVSVGEGMPSPTSICLVIVYRYNGWNEPSGLASSTLESVRWHFKTTLKLRTGFARARETEERSG